LVASVSVAAYTGGQDSRKTSRDMKWHFGLSRCRQVSLVCLVLDEIDKIDQRDQTDE
jgi:hypothetical protein